jgi:plasmid maintenance system antidote protein VapI
MVYAMPILEVNLMRKINKKLKARIFEVFGTQGDYAQQIGEDETLVSKIICGRRTLSSEKKKKWAKALGRKPQDIFSEHK